MPKAISFNTRRLYTEHGQRIAAVEFRNGFLFVDRDRGIEGFALCQRAWDLDKATVMAAYDFSLYGGREYDDETHAALFELREACELVPSMKLEKSHA